MFAGMPSVSAEDAWFLTALDVGHAIISLIPLIGGSIDSFKCFDQVVRLLLYTLLLIGGFLPSILTAYIN